MSNPQPQNSLPRQGGGIASLITSIRQLKLLKTTTILLVITLITTITLPSSNNAHAALPFSVNIADTPKLTLVVPSNVVIDVTPVDDGGTLGVSSNFNVVVGTSNYSGYTLSMSSSNGTITHTATSASDRTGTINALPYTSTGYTEQDFKEDTSTTNTWGYTLVSSNLPESGNNKYYSIYNGTDYIANINNNTTPVNSDITTMSYAIKVDDTLPAGSYTTTITFIATTNQNPHFMQDIASWKNELVEPRQSLKALDIRDNKTYWVTKLETDPNIPEDLPGDNLPSSAGKRADCETIDGTRHCYQIWMTQNLDLDLTTTRTYTHYDTDLGYTSDNNNANWTPENDTMTDVSGWIVGDDNRSGKCFDEDCSYEYGDVYIYTSGDNSNDTFYDSLSTCATDGHTEENCLHYSAGNLYNFHLATTLSATDNASINPQNSMPNSICPAGWRLPVGMMTEASEYTGNTWSDFGYLLHQNGVIANYGNWQEKINYTSDGFNKFRMEPLWFSRAGFVRRGQLFSDGMSGENGWSAYWTGYAKYFTSGVDMAFRYFRITILDESSRAYGYSVRCIAR